MTTSTVICKSRFAFVTLEPFHKYTAMVYARYIDSNTNTLMRRIQTECGNVHKKIVSMLYTETKFSMYSKKYIFHR